MGAKWPDPLTYRQRQVLRCLQAGAFLSASRLGFGVWLAGQAGPYPRVHPYTFTALLERGLIQRVSRTDAVAHYGLTEKGQSAYSLDKSP
jgi:hypothetical protein